MYYQTRVPLRERSNNNAFGIARNPFLTTCSSLGAVHPDAYEAYQTSHNLRYVVEKTCASHGGPSKTVDCGAKAKIDVKLSLLTPILPMLVSSCC